LFFFNFKLIKLNNKSTRFDDLFRDYIRSAEQYWYLGEDMPSLGDVRGRIVLLRRFFTAHTPLGIDLSGWRHNSTFFIKNHENFRLYIQDEYKLAAKRKWEKVKHLLDTNLVFRGGGCSNETDLVWNWNYCSAQKWAFGQPPRYIAWSINRTLKDYIVLNKFDFILNSSGVGSAGMILIVDFADKKLIEKIFLLNFSQSFCPKLFFFFYFFLHSVWLCKY
jgi:hypothetical protein